MRKLTALAAGAAAASLALVGLLVPPAGAGHDRNPSAEVRTYVYDLGEVANNDPGATGEVRLTALPNGKIQVKVSATGLAPNLPHAQHLHGIFEEENGEFVQGICPGIGRDVDSNGLVDTVEGQPDYGAVRVSLTTEGPTDAGSALAVDRFPVADENGVLEYNRTFTPEGDLAESIFAELGDLEIVVHGVDVNGSGGYDFESGTSPLSGALPLEATLPSVCGGPRG